MLVLDLIELRSQTPIGGKRWNGVGRWYREALKQLAGSGDTNHDEVVRMRVKDCIEPEASDLRKQLQGRR